MRKKCMAGNWKMNTNLDEGRILATSLAERIGNDGSAVDVIVCPPFTHLLSVSEQLQGTSVKLGAQNMYFEEKGAYTGEISPLMLQGLCSHVIIGHSERRQYFAETDTTVNAKILAALAHSIVPIVCVGEALEIRNRGDHLYFVQDQTRAAFAGIELTSADQVLVAYEPIWAIGTGLTASDAQAQEVIASIRQTLSGLYSEAMAQSIRILYGGSANAENIAGLLTQSDIDGALVGGASLKVESFAAMVEAAR